MHFAGVLLPSCALLWQLDKRAKTLDSKFTDGPSAVLVAMPKSVRPLSCACGLFLRESQVRVPPDAESRFCACEFATDDWRCAVPMTRTV